MIGRRMSAAEAVACADRVCIVLLSGIGDVVHGLAVANALKAQRPDRELVWVAQPAPAQILDAHPAIDRVVVFHRDRGVRGLGQLWSVMRRERCPVALNLQWYFKGIWPTLFSGAPTRIGLPPKKTRDGERFINTHHLPDGPWKHSQDIFLDMLDLIEVPRPSPLRWDLTLTAAERAEAQDFFAGLGSRPIAAVAVASSNRKKDWPAERYIPLVDALQEDLGFRVLLIGGPAAREQNAARQITNGARSAPAWGLADSVRRLMWSIEGADLVISPDTSSVHIAHAFGVPVVGLYGHTNPARVGPYRDFRDLVIDRYTDADEEPDPDRWDPRHGRMEQISIADVLDRVQLARALYGVRT